MKYGTSVSASSEVSSFLILPLSSSIDLRATPPRIKWRPFLKLRWQEFFPLPSKPTTALIFSTFGTSLMLDACTRALFHFHWKSQICPAVSFGLRLFFFTKKYQFTPLRDGFWAYVSSLHLQLFWGNVLWWPCHILVDTCTIFCSELQFDFSDPWLLDHILRVLISNYEFRSKGCWLEDLNCHHNHALGVCWLAQIWVGLR